MNSENKRKHIIKIIIAQVLVLGAILGFLEIGARLLFPEFKGQISSHEKTLGMNSLYEKFKGFRVRVPHRGYKFDTNSQMLIILGDSISEGYGMAYEDIYWVKLQRLININSDYKLQVISLADSGNNLADSTSTINALLNDKSLKIAMVLYQFNFNDITAYKNSDLKNLGKENILYNELFIKIGRLRHQYLNYSVAFRVLQHYLGLAIRNRYGSCEERGLDALGSYTWTFGSKKYKVESEEYWRQFKSELLKLKLASKNLNTNLAILISPILFDIDKKKKHCYYNPYRLDFSCSTIKPRERLDVFASEMDLMIIDPTNYLRDSFEARIMEGNFVPYFFTADSNHFTPVTSSYIAEYLFPKIMAVLNVQHFEK